MVDAELQKVARAARKAALAREQLHDAIRTAHRSGVSLRAIATEANLSHESVRKIAAR